MSLNPPTEHQLLVFWVGLLVILVAARLLGGNVLENDLRAPKTQLLQQECLGSN